jgi:hypothetical protein
MNPHHKVTKIIREADAHRYHVQWVEMDCPVQPQKIWIITKKIKVNQIFDPHFSNKQVIARYRPTEYGFNAACATAEYLANRIKF